MKLLFALILIVVAVAALVIAVPSFSDDSSAEGPDVGTVFTVDKITYEITGNGGGKLSTVTVLTCDADLKELRIGDTVDYAWGTPAVTYTYDVTAIADNAFKDHTKITLVTFGKNVATIGANAFYGCINIEGSISASSVTTIGEKAFYKCLKIESVTMNKVTSIPASAFERCALLETVSAVKATSVGNYAFYKCPSLEVCFTTTATSIGNYAFRDCTKLISDCIPTTVQTIGVDAYRNCYGFEGDLDLTGCTDLTTISDTAFYNCNNITSVETPDSLETIGSSAFAHCDSLQTVDIGAGVIDIEINAFNDNNNLESFTVDSANAFYRSYNDALARLDSGLWNIIKCPAKKNTSLFYMGNDVGAVESYAFQNCTLIESISLGDNVTRLGSNAFTGCTGLISVSIPASLTTIDGNPFSSCNHLQAINVDTGNPNYGNNAGDGVLYMKSGSDLTELITYPIAKTGTSYVVPNTVTKIRSNAFSGNSNLVDVTIPSSVSTIESYAFYNCPNLKGTDVGGGVYKLTVLATTISDWAFYNCDALENVILNHDLVSAKTNSFHACDNLKSFEMNQAIPDADDQYCTANGVLYLRDLTKDNITLFSCPYGLTTTSEAPLVIPESIAINGSSAEHVKNIGSYAFYGCKELTHLKLATTVSYIDINAFIACNKLAFIDATGSSYYSNVGNILYSADKTTLVLCPGASAAEEITIDSACTTINSYAFNNCTNIKVVRVPANVDTIGQYAFNGCNKVNTMYFESNPTHISEGAFSMGTSDTPASVIVYGCSDDQFRDYINQYTTIRYFHYMHYDLNDGTGTAPASTAGETGDYFNLPALGSWTKTGYYPLGWCADEAGTGSVYAFGNLYAYKSSDTTLYIKWVENEVKIVLSGNGDGSTDGQAYATYNSSAFSTELLKEFVHAARNGYTLNGYYTAASGGDKVIDNTTPIGAFVAGVSGYTDADGKWINPTANGGTVTLYAQWTPITYTVTFDKNGGAADGGATYTFDNTTYDSGTFTGVTRTGYELLGYYTESTDGLKVINPDGTVVKGVTGYSDADGKWKYYTSSTLTLYAQWKIIDYTITYNLDDGTNNPSNPATYTYETDTITLGDPTKTGYTFDGWFDNSECTGTAVTQIVKNSTGNKELWAKWTLTEYDIIYNNLEGATNHPDNPAKYTYTTPTITLKEPTKTGYRFMGWFSDSTFDTPYSHIEVGSTGDKTVYAKWEANTYVVEFIGGTGTTGSTSIQNFTYDVAQNLNSNGFVKTTYKFKGWDTDSSADTVVYTDEANVKNLTTTHNDTVYLYAVWEQKGTYHAYFYDDTTPLTSLTIDKIADEHYTMPTYKSGGNTIVGWNTDPAFGSSTFVAIGAEVKMLESNITYYAQWSAAGLIAVNYDVNGGSKPLDQIHVLESQPFNLSYYDGTKTGYHLQGWKDSLNNVYAPGASYTAGTTDLTFTAVWIANTYTIQFDKNDADVESGTMAPQVFTYDAGDTPLTANAFTKTGYHFIGWSETKFATTADYDDQELINNLTSVDQKLYHFYPVWEINTWTVTADLDGGTVEETPAGWTYVDDHTYTKVFDYNTPWSTINASFGTMPTREGYKSPAWETTSGNLGDDNATNKILWTANSYTVHFNGNGNTGGSTADQAFAYGTAQNLTANGFTKTGYTFAGWATSDSGAVVYNDKQSVNELTSVDGATFNLYAKWTINQYKVTVELVGGSVEETPDTWNKTDSDTYWKNFDYNTPWSTINASFGTMPTKTGYKDPVWTKTSGNLGAAADTNTIIWTANSYTVHFNGNGNTGGSTADQVFAYGTAQNLTANGFTKTGYTFAGWATSDSGAVVYNDKQSVNELTSVDGATYNLYAKWTANAYKVHFNGNDSTGGSMADQDFTYDVAQNLTLNGFLKTGYSFAGWATSDSGAVVYSNGQSVSNLATTGTCNLYAKWTPNTTDITFNKGEGATGGTDGVTATYDAEMPAGVIGPSKTGYLFQGYFLSAGGQGNKYYNADCESVATWNLDQATCTLYAYWLPIEYEVAFDKNSGSGSMPNEDFKYDESKALSANTYSRVGYTFGGWATTAGGAKTYDDNQTVSNLTTVDGTTVTLYAVWNPISYKIDLNGHGAEDGFLYVTFDSHDLSNLNIKYRTGYTLLGYTLTDGGTDYLFTSSDGINVELVADVTDYTDADAKWIKASGVEVHARWNINQYTVTADLTDGKMKAVPGDWDRIDDSTYQKKYDFDTAWTKIINDFTTGTGVTITPEKEGHTFSSWSYASTTLPAYDSSMSVVWTVNQYTVTAVLDDKLVNDKGIVDKHTDWSYDAVSNTYSRSFDYATPWTTIQGTLSKPHATYYTFDAWSPSSGTLGAGAATMTAQWTKNVYTAVVNLNGGYLVTSPTGAWIQISDDNYVCNFEYETTWAQVSASLDALGKARPGYEFTSWSYPTDGSTGPNKDFQTVTANWFAGYIQVSFDSSGGSAPVPASKQVVYGEAYGELPAVTKPGYVFVGWFTSTNDLVTSTSIVGIATDHTLHAEWYGDEMVHVNVPSGGPGYTVTAGPAKIYKGSDYVFTVSAAVGYTGTIVVTADGTHGDIVYSGDISNCTVTIRTVMTDIDNVVISGLTPKSYTVTLDDTSSTRTITVKYNCAMPSGVQAPERAGFVFGGYFDQKNGAGTMYYNSSMEGTFVWVSASDGTLYAYWITAEQHTVTFDLNGGSGSAPSSITVLRGQSFTVPGTDATKKDYKFSGWNDGSRSYEVGSEVIMGSSDIVLKAVWAYNEQKEEETTTISGSVVDEFGSAYASAEIFIDGEFYCVTGVNGQFSVKDISKDIHSLMVRTVKGSKLIYDTSMIDLRNGSQTVSVVIKSENANSILSITDGSDITAAVKDLNTEAKSQYSGTNITVWMSVDNSLATIEGKGAQFTMLKDSMGRPCYQVFDVSVYKTTYGGSSAPIAKTNNLLKLAVKVDTGNMKNIIVADLIGGTYTEMAKVGSDAEASANTYSVDDGWIYVYMDTSAPVAIGYEQVSKPTLSWGDIGWLIILLTIATIISIYIVWSKKKKDKAEKQ